ncbi:cellulose binding domain-containing protein [Actinoplanes awajinensis]|uniref:CBM2 domain-containing protein n=1 Tax=Actinoplanes awajinensis subsp. mycoplanecinus TaxID=135947 RepID=A0A101JER1_9ACTN|nr:cellulose binding domain-containing protein [Actinoplanes awajinensis]KUL25504.1 hypothetical protein ADL15_40580 [Actinoplanes awajinensis subsp. mycoplanecinus]
MNDTGSRQRRSLTVVLLDGVLRLLTITPTPKVHDPGARRGLGRYAVLAGLLAALAGTVLLVVVLVRDPGDPAPPPDPAAALPGAPRSADPAWPQPVLPSSATVTTTATSAAPASATPSASSGPVRVVPGTSPSAGSVPVTGSTPVPLTAAYQTSGGLLGAYRMTVTVANPGTTAANGWTLTVTLPRATLRVGSVTGATAAQDGSTWTFVPDTGTSPVPAGGSVAVAFTVSGATLIDAAPQGCSIDGTACTS